MHRKPPSHPRSTSSLSLHGAGLVCARGRSRNGRPRQGYNETGYTMSSTEIVHGSNNDNDSPQSGFSGGNNDHPASYAVQAQVQSAPGAMSAGVADSSGTGTDDKRFTTSYGMVVWPTLPGLSSSTSPSSAPAPAPGTQMTCSAPADLVHHHSPSEATAAPTTAQTLLPGTMATMASHANDVVNGGGGPLVRWGVCSSMCAFGTLLYPQVDKKSSRAIPCKGALSVSHHADQRHKLRGSKFVSGCVCVRRYRLYYVGAS